VDIDGIQQTCRALARRIDMTGLASVDPSVLRIRLRTERPSPRAS
jgi:hypothetical protein